jgi:hypothetical protein
MSAFSDWAKGQAAAMAQGAKEVGKDAIADVGNTYQAFLMSDAGWRVPHAHDDFTAPEAIAEAAGREQIEHEAEPPPPQVTANLDYC